MQVAARALLAGSALQVVSAGLLVFGAGPLPAMGIAGAAAGIVIGTTLSALLLLRYLAAQCVEMRLRSRGVPFSLTTMAAILRQGALASVNPFCTLASVLVITAFIARLGVDVLAGYGIGARLELLLVPMIFGFGAASTVMVGVHFGANALDRGLRAGWTAAIYSATLCG
ncbi:MAG: MATE family efflux transporter, partial [bacterium]